jgi:hypothetical protein
VEKLAINLKALNPAQEVNPCILLITNRRKGKSIVIRLDICLKGLAKRIIAYKEVIKV